MFRPVYGPLLLLVGLLISLLLAVLVQHLSLEAWIALLQVPLLTGLFLGLVLCVAGCWPRVP